MVFKRRMPSMGHKVIVSEDGRVISSVVRAWCVRFNDGGMWAPWAGQIVTFGGREAKGQGMAYWPMVSKEGAVLGAEMLVEGKCNRFGEAFVGVALGEGGLIAWFDQRACEEAFTVAGGLGWSVYRGVGGGVWLMGQGKKGVWCVGERLI